MEHYSLNAELRETIEKERSFVFIIRFLFSIFFFLCTLFLYLAGISPELAELISNNDNNTFLNITLAYNKPWILIIFFLAPSIYYAVQSHYAFKYIKSSEKKETYLGLLYFMPKGVVIGIVAFMYIILFLAILSVNAPSLFILE